MPTLVEVNRTAAGARRAFLAAVADTKRWTNAEDIEAAVAGKALTAAEMAVPFERMVDGLAPLRVVVTDEWERGAKSAVKDATSRFEYDPLRPTILHRAEGHGARLVTEVTASTRRAIADAITDAVAANLHPRDVAVRVRDLIGLHSRQVKANERYRLSLIEDGASEERAAKLAARHAERALKQRAELIARTEMMRASNQGRQVAWETAARMGALDESAVERRWDTAEDKRVCPICGPMDGTTRGITEPFETGDGRFVMTGPVHPDCRCSVSIVEIERRRAA